MPTAPCAPRRGATVVQGTMPSVASTIPHGMTAATTCHPHISTQPMAPGKRRDHRVGTGSGTCSLGMSFSLMGRWRDAVSVSVESRLALVEFARPRVNGGLTERTWARKAPPGWRTGLRRSAPESSRARALRRGAPARSPFRPRGVPGRYPDPSGGAASTRAP